MIDKILESIEPIESETLKQVYGISEDKLDLAHAMQSLVHSTRYWEDSFVFEKIVRAINGLSVNFVNLQGVRPEHIWSALKVSKEVWPEREFSWEVQKYVQWISNEDGLYVYPFEMDELDNRFYEGTFKLIEKDIELQDRNVYEVQASKILAIHAYLNKTKKTK